MSVDLHLLVGVISIVLTTLSYGLIIIDPYYKYPLLLFVEIGVVGLWLSYSIIIGDMILTSGNAVQLAILTGYTIWVLMYPRVIVYSPLR